MVTETVQAQYLVRSYLINLANDVPSTCLFFHIYYYLSFLLTMSHKFNFLSSVSIWYDFIDDGTDNTNSEHRFGTYKYPLNIIFLFFYFNGWYFYLITVKEYIQDWSACL